MHKSKFNNICPGDLKLLTNKTNRLGYWLLGACILKHLSSDIVVILKYCTRILFKIEKLSTMRLKPSKSTDSADTSGPTETFILDQNLLSVAQLLEGIGMVFEYIQEGGSTHAIQSHSDEVLAANALNMSISTVYNNLTVGFVLHLETPQRIRNELIKLATQVNERLKVGEFRVRPLDGYISFVATSNLPSENDCSTNEGRESVQWLVKRLICAGLQACSKFAPFFSDVVNENIDFVRASSAISSLMYRSSGHMQLGAAEISDTVMRAARAQGLGNTTIVPSAGAFATQIVASSLSLSRRKAEVGDESTDIVPLFVVLSRGLLRCVVRLFEFTAAVPAGATAGADEVESGLAHIRRHLAELNSSRLLQGSFKLVESDATGTVRLEFQVDYPLSLPLPPPPQAPAGSASVHAGGDAGGSPSMNSESAAGDQTEGLHMLPFSSQELEEWLLPPLLLCAVNTCRRHYGALAVASSSLRGLLNPPPAARTAAADPPLLGIIRPLQRDPEPQVQALGPAALAQQMSESLSPTYGPLSTLLNPDKVTDVEGPIGRGGMGVAYKAKYAGTIVVLKEVSSV